MGLWGLSKAEKNLWSSIEAGDKVKFFVKKNAGERYESVVEKKSNAYMEILTPKVENAFLELPPNIKVIVEIEVNAADVSQIRFISKVVRHIWLKSNTIQLSCPRSIKRIELRKYYRVETDATGEFSFVEKRTSEKIDIRYPFFPFQVKNISEGGMVLILEKLPAIQKGALVDLSITLPVNVGIRARGKVVRIDAIHDKYGLGVEFLKMNKGDRKFLHLFITQTRRAKSNGVNRGG